MICFCFDIVAGCCFLDNLLDDKPILVATVGRTHFRMIVAVCHPASQIGRGVLQLVCFFLRSELVDTRTKKCIQEAKYSGFFSCSVWSIEEQMREVISAGELRQYFTDVIMIAQLFQFLRSVLVCPQCFHINSRQFIFATQLIK